MHYTLPFASPTISHRTPLGPSCDRLAGIPARDSDVTFGPVLLTFHMCLRFVLSAGGTIVHAGPPLIGARAVPVPFWSECIYTLSP